MPTLAAKSPGPKIRVSMRLEACAIASMLTRPSGLSICTSSPIRPVEPELRLELREQPVGELHIAGRLDLREHHAVERRTGALDDVHDVAEAPAGARVVHTHDLRGRLPVLVVERVDDVLSRASFFSSGATASSRSRKT